MSLLMDICAEEFVQNIRLPSVRGNSQAQEAKQQPWRQLKVCDDDDIFGAKHHSDRIIFQVSHYILWMS